MLFKMSDYGIGCPLCCNEKFYTRSSLQTHLSKLMEKLKCTFCNKKFKDLKRLIIHLDKFCNSTVRMKVNVGTKALDENQPGGEGAASKAGPVDGSIEPKKGSFFCQICLIFFENVTEHLEQFHQDLQANQDDDDDDDDADDDDDDESENMSDDNPLVVEYKETSTEVLTVKEGDEDKKPEGGYFCEICWVDFENVQKHLKEFHQGEEVTLENEEMKTPDEDPFSSNQDDAPPQIKGEDGSEVGKELAGSQVESEEPEEDFKDNEGRSYSRKFVKIDKFWLGDESMVEPIIQNYIVEDGEVKSIPGDLLEDLGDDSKVIRIHQCPKCSLLFPELDNYRRHQCEELSTPSKIKCSLCNTLLDTMDNLKLHIKALHGKPDQSTVSPLSCDVCNTVFPTFKSLRLHKRMHDPIKQRTANPPANADESDDMFICKICNKSYHKQYEEVHMKAHNTISDGYNCDICNRKFFTESNLKMHMRVHTGTNKKFACSYCKKPFMTFAALNEHLSNQCHKRQYACKFCGRRFTRPHEKVKHERIHTGEKPHVCEICNKAFRVSYCLTLHMRTHSGSRPYQCTHCGKRFKSHSAYNHHLQTHSDVRAYKCPFCPKAFKTSVQLAGHKNSHTKPFSCTECNRPYASLYAVRAHMETHKKDNNLRHVCWHCGAQYSRGFALRDHIKEQHLDAVSDKAEVDRVEYDEGEDADEGAIQENDLILGLDGGANIEIIANDID